MKNNIEFYMGSFHNGNIEPEPLPVTGSAKINLDILNSSSMDLNIATKYLEGLEEGVAPENLFPILKKIVIAVNSDLPWDAEGKILFGGYINKTSSSVAKGIITLGIASIEECLKGINITAGWDTITNPETSITFSGATWQQVQARIVEHIMEQVGTPSSAPQPPRVLGTRPAVTGDTVKKVVLASEAPNYTDTMTEVRDTDSTAGEEWQFVPRFTDSTMTKVVWDLRVGTASVPQINSNNVIPITLEDEYSIKPSAASTIVDSTNYFNRLSLQSKNGEGTSGMDLELRYKPGTQDEIIQDAYQSFGVELTPQEMAAQFSSRMQDAGATGRTFTITTEEADFSLWYNRLGSKLVISGESAITSGHAGTFRLLAIDFTADKDSLTLTVAQPQRVYPLLPKNRIKNFGGGRPAGSNLNSKRKVESASGGGGGAPIPPQPWEPGNPENPGDGGAGAAWGLNAGYEIGTQPTYNDSKVVGTQISIQNLPWGNPQPTDNQVIIQNESNILHFIQNFGPLQVRTYTFAEAPTFPVGLGLGQQSPTAFWSAFMQEGIIKSPTQLASRNVLTDANLNLAFQNAGEKALWSRPPAVEIPPGANPLTHPGNISYFYVYQITISPRARFAVSIGGKIIIPITFQIMWARDNANSDGNAPTGWGGGSLNQEFTTFFEASYSGLSEVGEFLHKTNFILSGGLLYASGRAGSFYLFKKTGAPSIVWSMNMGGASGLDENCFISPPLPTNATTQHMIHFGDFWDKGLCLIGGMSNDAQNSTQGWKFYYYQIPSGKTAPVIDGGGQWQEVRQTSGVINRSTPFDSLSTSFLTAFDGKPIITRASSSYYMGAHILDGTNSLSKIVEGTHSEIFKIVFCYRNFVYILSTSGSNRYYSARVDYLP